MSLNSVTLKMEGVCGSETSVCLITVQCRNPKDTHQLNNKHCEKQKAFTCKELFSHSAVAFYPFFAENKTFRVVYVDKALPPRCLTTMEKNLWFHKFGIKSLICRRRREECSE